jgi:hypothetical protein
VDQVEVDRQDGRRTFVLRDDVVVPDLLDESAGARVRHGRDSGWREFAWEAEA